MRIPFALVRSGCAARSADRTLVASSPRIGVRHLDLLDGVPSWRKDDPVRLLVLGGTRFVGRLIVEAAIARSHQVTAFNRGRSGSDAAGAEAVRGDRENAADLTRLVDGREWDAVIDTSGYVPAVVGNAAR